MTMARITACSSLGYAAFTLEEAVQRISVRGFTRLEIAHMGSYCIHYPLDRVDPAGVKRLLADHGLTPVAMNYYTGWVQNGVSVMPKLNNPDEARRLEADMQRLLLQAQQLGLRTVLIPPGKRSTAPDRRDEVEKAAVVVSRLADFADGLGIRLALEVPHCYTLCDSLEHVAEMFALVSSPHLGAVIDSTHWHVIGYEISDYMKIVGHRLCHAHLRDAAGTDTADFRQTLELTPGRGEVDFVKFGRELDRFGYRGEVTLELEYRTLSLEEVEAEYDFAVQHLKRCGWAFPPEV
jgi:2-keto-myo-inositol isomerase